MKVMMTALAMDPTMWLPSFEGQNSRGRIPISIAAEMNMTVGKTMAWPDPGFALHHNPRREQEVCTDQHGKPGVNACRHRARPAEVETRP